MRVLLMVTAACGLLLAAGACERQGGGGATTQTSAAAACPHQIKKDMCPFCNPEKIEAEGFCGEHGVAEALCAQCRPYLKAAFRAKGDWCEQHGGPDSQCLACHPELAENLRPGEHGVEMPPAKTDPTQGPGGG